MSNPLPHDKIIPFKDSQLSKKEQVAEMFNGIAGRYDLMNRVLSAGIDISWRKKAIRLLGRHNPRHILDVATGTADMAIMAARMLPSTQITGIDISGEMLAIGRKKVEKEGLENIITLQSGDGETINHSNNTFDGIMVAFGVRNFENLNKGLSEMLRVLQPGGRIVILEFSKPKWRIMRKLYNLYMGIVAPQVARWFRQNKEAYTYLDESSRAFPDREQFTAILDQVGFSDTECKPLSAGICCIYTGRKP